MEYTRDDWEVTKSLKGDWAIQGKKTGILICREARHYNAHLIAAAPDMYEALQTISAFYSDTGYKNVMPSMVEAVRKINRAIAKAEGK